MAELVNLDALADILAEKLLQKLKPAFSENQSADNIREKTGPAYLSRLEVADLFKITLPTVNAWVRQGRLKAHRIGRRVLFKAEDLEKSLSPVKTSVNKKTA